jgi:hypothetical protein
MTATHIKKKHPKAAQHTREQKISTRNRDESNGAASIFPLAQKHKTISIPQSFLILDG